MILLTLSFCEGLLVGAREKVVLTITAASADGSK